MTRLVYSEEAYVRSLQISGSQIFAFVEGGLDRPFMDRILELSSQGKTKYRVIAAKELPGETGGKTKVIEWFSQLSNKGLLSGNRFGKKYSCIFLADKDADDFINKKIDSPHLIYTSTYDIEGHLFLCGDLVRALSDSALITMEQAKQIIQDRDSWLREICENWSDWLALCLISRLRSINVGCSYERMSTINHDGLGTVNEALLSELKEKVRQAIGCSVEEFASLYSESRSLVSRSILDGQFLRYFKGKWIKGLLQKKCETIRIPDANFNGIGDRVVSVLVSRVANGALCSCSEQYIKKTEAIIAQIV